MIISVLILFLLLIFVYGRRFFVNDYSNRGLFYGKPLILFFSLTLLGPFLLLSIILPEHKRLSPEEAVEVAEKYGMDERIRNAYEMHAKSNKESINSQIRYIDIRFRLNPTYIYLCRKIEHDYITNKTEVGDLSRWYIDKKCKNRNPNDSTLHAMNQEAPGVNFMLGFSAQKEGDFESAIHHYKKEISINPELPNSYQNLFTIYRKGNKEALDKFINNPELVKHINPYKRRVFYYQKGYYSNYLKEVFNLVEKIPRLSTFLIALISSLVWIGYLWMLDIFNREKWYDIAAVFVLGSIATLGSAIFYDFAHLNFDFRINGDGWNDFWYCTIVIGGSEELVKFLPWIIYGTLANKFKEPFDYILYASVAALGFAFVENLMYFENFFNIVGRTMMSSVSHMVDASIVAFAFIIARYKLPKNSIYKWPVIIGGFLLAMLAHGFYDFWLISPEYKDRMFITYIFFFVSLHIWFYFKNNAINFSPYFCDASKFNKHKKKDYINISILGILMLQYIVVSFEMGSGAGQIVFLRNGIFVALFIIYMHFQLELFSVGKNSWRDLQLKEAIPIFNKDSFAKRISGYFGRSTNPLGGVGGAKSNHIKNDFTGLKLRLFAPKTNPYIGNQLPVSGKCIKRITVADDPNWYLFELNSPVKYSNYESNRIIIRHKDDNKSLQDDKIEIFFMFIPKSSLLKLKNIPITELRYADRVYSRPV